MLQREPSSPISGTAESINDQQPEVEGPPKCFPMAQESPNNCQKNIFFVALSDHVPETSLQPLAMIVNTAFG